MAHEEGRAAEPNPWAPPGEPPPKAPPVPQPPYAAAPAGPAPYAWDGRQPAAGAPTAGHGVPPVPPAPSPAPGMPPGGYGYPTGPPGGYGHPAGPGYAPPPYQVPQPGYAGWAPLAAKPPTSGICTASMVVGIVAMSLTLTLWGAFLGILAGPVALGLAIAARRRINRGTAHGSGFATAGLVLGIVATAVSAVFVALLLAFVITAPAEEDFGPGYDEYGYDASVGHPETEFVV